MRRLMAAQFIWGKRSTNVYILFPLINIQFAFPHLKEISMKIILTALLALPFVFGSVASACSFMQVIDIFKPSLERWEHHPSPAQQGGEGAYWEEIPAPIVRNIRIKRGIVAAGSSCDDAGTLAFNILLPAKSTYSIEEFGVYFRIKSGTFPEGVLLDFPLTGTIKGRKSQFFFPWLDGHPSQQTPINAVLEVFFVSDGLNIGPSRFVRLTSEPTR